MSAIPYQHQIKDDKCFIDGPDFDPLQMKPEAFGHLFNRIYNYIPVMRFYGWNFYKVSVSQIKDKHCASDQPVYWVQLEFDKSP